MAESNLEVLTKINRSVNRPIHHPASNDATVEEDHHQDPKIVVYVRQMLPEDVLESIKCFQDQYDVFDCPCTIEAFVQLDPQSFLIAYIVLDSSQELVIGCCGSPLGPNRTNFIGLYGIHPQYRGLGIGQKLFTKCCERIRKIQNNCGLYAVPEMLMKYINQAGFSIRENVSMVMFVGQSKLEREDFREKIPDGIQVRKVTRENSRELIPLLIEYDSRIHNEPREKLLKLCLEHADYETLLILDHRNDNNEQHHLIKGYGCIRQHTITKRYYLGPLYADTPGMARILARELWCPHHRQISGNGMIWNAIDANPRSLIMAGEDFGLIEIERCERLFTKHLVNGVQYRSIYSVFSPDFSL